MKTKILIEAGYKGIDLQQIDVNGIDVSKEVPLTKNFNRKDILGMVKPYIEDNKVYIDADIDESKIGLYPAIGFMAHECEVEEINGIRYIKSLKLYEVSLCNWPNCDPNIEPIK